MFRTRLPLNVFCKFRTFFRNLDELNLKPNVLDKFVLTSSKLVKRSNISSRPSDNFFKYAGFRISGFCLMTLLIYHSPKLFNLSNNIFLQSSLFKSSSFLSEV